MYNILVEALYLILMYTSIATPLVKSPWHTFTPFRSQDCPTGLALHLHLLLILVLQLPRVETTLLFFLALPLLFPYFSRAISRKGTLGTTSRRGEGGTPGNCAGEEAGPAEAEGDLGMARLPAITCADFIAVPDGAAGGRDYSHGRFEGKETSLVPP